MHFFSALQSLSVFPFELLCPFLFTHSSPFLFFSLVLQWQWLLSSAKQKLKSLLYSIFFFHLHPSILSVSATSCLPVSILLLVGSDVIIFLWGPSVTYWNPVILQSAAAHTHKQLIRHSFTVDVWWKQSVSLSQSIW